MRVASRTTTGPSTSRELPASRIPTRHSMTRTATTAARKSSPTPRSTAADRRLQHRFGHVVLDRRQVAAVRERLVPLRLRVRREPVRASGLHPRRSISHSTRVRRHGRRRADRRQPSAGHLQRGLPRRQELQPEWQVQGGDHGRRVQPPQHQHRPASDRCSGLGCVQPHRGDPEPAAHPLRVETDL